MVLISGKVLKNSSALSGPRKLDAIREMDKDLELPGFPKECNKEIHL